MAHNTPSPTEKLVNFVLSNQLLVLACKSTMQRNPTRPVAALENVLRVHVPNAEQREINWDVVADEVSGSEMIVVDRRHDQTAQFDEPFI